MIQSLYTILFEKNNRCFIYNSLSEFFAEIPKDLYVKLFNRTYSSLPHSVVEKLKLKGILIEENEKYQYYYESLLKFRTMTYNSSVLGLVIVPTTGCNFDCPYCFEGEKKGICMTDEIQLQLVKFIMRQPNLKTINLTWYGGEPLLAFKRIKSLYQAISSIDNINIGGHSMLTNGYLITPEVIDFMQFAQLRSLQITMDGTRDNHNQTRFLKSDKQPTYDRIMNNINMAVKNLPDCNISIRVNINKQNRVDYISIFKEIKQTWKDVNISVYPGFIREETADDCTMTYSCLRGEDYFLFLKECMENGLNVDFMPRRVKTKGCMLNHLNSFIVGPEGELYKCWNDVNHSDKIIGNIQEKQFTNHKLFYHYLMEVTPFTLDKCKECFLFPVCGGGCGHYLSRNLSKGACYDICPVYKNRHISRC